jgi:predicted nucleic acid-binding Zn ribbon protein
MGFERVSDVLRKIQEKNGKLATRIREATAFQRWESAVGPLIAKHSRALRVENGVLVVEVDHSAWKSELHYRKRQILDLLNAGQSGKMVIIQDIWFLERKIGPK